MLGQLKFELLDNEVTHLLELAAGLRLERVERRGDAVAVWMLGGAAQRRSDRFLLWLELGSYPERPPDARFLNPVTLQDDPNWWPRDYRLPSGASSIFRSDAFPPFVCAPPFLAWRERGHAFPTPAEWTLEQAVTAVATGINRPEYSGYNRSG